MSRLFKSKLELFAFVDLLKHPREVFTLLTSNLRRRCVVGSSCVSASKDVIEARYAQLVVDDETATLVLDLLADLRHNALGQGTGSVASRPYEEAVRDAVRAVSGRLTIGCYRDSLEQVLLLVLSNDVLIGHFLDHGARQDIDLVLLESGRRVVTASQQDRSESADRSMQSEEPHMSCLENIGKTLGRASIKVILTFPAISGYQFCRSSVKKSCSSAAYL